MARTLPKSCDANRDASELRQQKVDFSHNLFISEGEGGEKVNKPPSLEKYA
jgi:hypothetical protein